MTRRLLPLALLASACSGGMQDPSTVEQQDGACVALEGRRFISINDLECGLTPSGVALCKWRLSFMSSDDTSSRFQWSYSDVGEGGLIECHGEKIDEFSHQRPINGTFDPVSQKLVWEGQTYVPAQ